MKIHSGRAIDRRTLETFLTYACLQKESDIQAWIKYRYEPDTAFTAYEGEQLIGLMQCRMVPMQFGRHRVQAAQIVDAAVHPDFRQQAVFSHLLDQVMIWADANALCTLVLTNQPFLYRSHRFEPYGQTITYWLEKPDRPLYTCETRTNADIFSLYEYFISCFDGSIRLPKEAFTRQIHYQRGQIFLSRYDHEIDGAAFCHADEHTIQIEPAFYTDSSALMNLVGHAFEQRPAVSLTVGEDERIERFLTVKQARRKDTCLIHLNTASLFEPVFKQPIHHAEELKTLLKAPAWNYWI